MPKSKITPGDRAFIGAFCRYTRAAILSTGAPRASCILSTRIGIAILHKYRIPCRPVCVRAVVANQAHYEDCEAQGRLPLISAEAPVIDFTDGTRWSVALGFPDAVGPGWSGHVGILVHGKVFVDLSLDQASRPERGIVCTPVYFDVDDSWVNGETTWHMERKGTHVFYTGDPDATEAATYRRAPDWNFGPDRVDEIVRAVLIAMRHNNFRTPH